jgi:hypothetical protein
MWEIIGALGEVAGAIAVIISLIYLAKQINANTKSNQSAAMIAIAGNALKELHKDKETAEILFRGMKDGLSQLDDAEKYICINRGMGEAVRWHLVCDLNENELIPAKTFETQAGEIAAAFQHLGFREVWPLIENSFPQDFRDYVDTSAQMSGPSIDFWGLDD